MNYKVLKLPMMIAALSGVIAGCGDDTTSAQHYATGVMHHEKGDNGSAIIEFKNALKKDPRNVHARLSLGLIYKERGYLAAAQKELARAIDKEQTKQQALVPYAAVLNNLGKANEILELPLLTSDLPIDSLVQAHYMRGRAFLSLDDKTKGRAELVKCKDQVSDSEYVMLCRATLSYIDEDTSQSQELVEQLLTHESPMPEALLLSGAIYTKQQEHAKSVNVYQKYIAQSKINNAMVNLLLAEALVNNNQPDEATVEIDALLEANPLQPVVNFLKVRILFEQENFELAFLHANNTVKGIPNHYLANLMGGISAFRVGDHQQSFRMLNRIDKQLTGKTVPVIMNVINNIKLGNIDGAKRVLKNAGPVDKSTMQLYMVAAKEFRAAQDYQTALVIIDQIHQIMPESEFVLFELGSVKIQMGDMTGIEELNKTLMSPTFSNQSMAILIPTYFKLGQQEKLADLASKLKEKLPESPNGWAIAGKLAVSKQDYKIAQKEFESILELDPSNIDALFFLTKLHSHKKDYQQALESIERALVVAPENVRLLTLKARIVFLTSEDASLANEVMIKAYGKFPKNNDLLVERALIHAENKELKQGILLLASIADKTGLSNKFWDSYGELLIRDNRKGEALTVYEQWGKQQNSTPIPLLKQIALTERMRLFEQGSALIAQGEKRFSHIKQFGLLDVSFTMMAGKLTEASVKLHRLNEADYEPMNYGLISGELNIAQGKFKEGIERLLPVYEKTKKARPLKGLANAYLATDQYKKAIAVMEKYLEFSPTDIQFKPVLAQAYVAIGDKNNAVAQYQTLVDAQPDNAILLNNLAWTLYDAGKPQMALEYADRALLNNKDSAQIFDTHGVILLALKDFEKARISLEKALSINPKSFVFNAHNSQLAIAMGDNDKAKKLLHAQMAQTKDDKALYDKVAKTLYGDSANFMTN